MNLPSRPHPGPSLRSGWARTACFSAILLAQSFGLHPLAALTEDAFPRRVGIEAHLGDRRVAHAFILLADGVYHADTTTNLIDGMAWSRSETASQTVPARFYPKLIPGKTYTLVAQTLVDDDSFRRNPLGAWVPRPHFHAAFDVPEGFQLEVGGVARSDLCFLPHHEENGPRYAKGTTTYPLRLIRTNNPADPTLEASALSSLSLGDTYLLSIGLGRTLSGADSGRLWVRRGFLEDPNLQAAPFGPGNLSATEIFDDSDLVRWQQPGQPLHGQFRQIRTREGLVDTVLLGADRFALRFYRGLSFPKLKGLYSPGQVPPYASVEFMLDRSRRTLRICREHGPNRLVVECAFTPFDAASGRWTLRQGLTESGHWLRETVVDYQQVAGNLRERVTVQGYDPNSGPLLAAVMEKTYAPIPWSTRTPHRLGLPPPPDIGFWPSSLPSPSRPYTDDLALISLRLDPDGDDLKTEIGYYADPAHPCGAFGKVRSIQAPDLTWSLYRYHTDTASPEALSVRGRLSSIQRPGSNGPRFHLAAAEDGEVTRFTDWIARAYPTGFRYSEIDQAVLTGFTESFYRTLAGQIEVKVDGITVARTIVSYQAATDPPGQRSYSIALPDVHAPYVQPLLETIRTSQYYGNGEGQHLVTELRQFGPDTSRGLALRPWRISHPDGLLEQWSYEVTAYTHTAVADSVIRSTRTELDADGALVPGRSRMEVEETRFDPRFFEEMPFVRQVFGFTSGREWMEMPESRLEFDSLKRLVLHHQHPYETRWSYPDGHDLPGTVEQGVALGSSQEKIASRHRLRYDALGRVVARILDAVPGAPADHPDRTLSFRYDPLDRLLSESTSASGLSLSRSARYDLCGRLVESADENGLTTTRQYSPNGHFRWERVINPGPPGGVQGSAGPEPFSFALTRYGLDGSVLSVSGSSEVGRVHQYGVCAATGNRWVRTFYGLAGAASPRWTQIERDWLGRVVRESQPPAPGHSDPRLSTHEYDRSGRLWRSRLPCPQDAGQSLDILFHSDHNGRHRVQALDVNRNGKIDFDGPDRVVEAHSFFEAIGQDLWEASIESVYGDGQGEQAVALSSTRHRRSGFDPGLLEESWSIDPSGNQSRTLSSLTNFGQSIRSTLDGTREAWSHALSIRGQLSAEWSPDGLGQAYVHDPLGRLIAHSDPRRGWTTTSWRPGRNQPSAVTFPDGSSEYFLFYPDGQPGAGQLYEYTDRAGNLSRFAYDGAGRILARWGSASIPLLWSYNEFGERVAQCSFRSDGEWWENQHPVATPPPNPTLDSLVQWSFDPASGLPSLRLDGGPDGADLTALHYHSGGALGAVQQFRGPQAKDPVFRFYNYHPATGDLARISFSDGTPSVSFTHDRRGRLVEVADQASGLHLLTYHDRHGLQAEEVVAHNHFHQPRHEILRHSTLLPDGRWVDGLPAGYEVSRADGLLGRVQVIRDWAGGRSSGLVLESQPHPAGSRLEIGIAHSPDPRFRQALSHPLNAGGVFQTEFQWAPHQDRLSTLRHTAAGRLVAGFAYQYDPAGRRIAQFMEGEISRRYAEGDLNGLLTGFTYGPRGVLSGVSSRLARGLGWHGPESPVPGRSTVFGFDSADNRVFAATETGLVAAHLDSGHRITHRNLPGLLTIAGFAAPEAELRFDGQHLPLGRRGEFFHALKPFDNHRRPVAGELVVHTSRTEPQGPSRVAAVTRPFTMPATPEFLRYDGRGNLVEDGQWLYGWDASNRLLWMERRIGMVRAGSDPLRLEFAYDYRGRRLAKKVIQGFAGSSGRTVTTTLFGWAGDRLVLEMDPQGNPLRQYFWEPYPEQAGALRLIRDYSTDPAGRSYYPAYDARGDLIALVDANDGSTAAFYEYDPWGILLRQSGSLPIAALNPFRAGTQFYDSETGLYAYHHRYYCPASARWLSRDPVFESGGHNLYAFCRNDPVNRVDDRGLCGSHGGSGTAMDQSKFAEGVLYTTADGKMSFTVKDGVFYNTSSITQQIAASAGGSMLDLQNSTVTINGLAQTLADRSGVDGTLTHIRRESAFVACQHLSFSPGGGGQPSHSGPLSVYERQTAQGPEGPLPVPSAPAHRRSGSDLGNRWAEMHGLGFVLGPFGDLLSGVLSFLSGEMSSASAFVRHGIMDLSAAILIDAFDLVVGTALGRPYSLYAGLHNKSLREIAGALLVPNFGFIVGTNWGYSEESGIAHDNRPFVNRWTRLDRAALIHDALSTDELRKKNNGSLGFAHAQFVSHMWSLPGHDPGPAGQILRLLATPIFHVMSKID